MPHSNAVTTVRAAVNSRIRPSIPISSKRGSVGGASATIARDSHDGQHQAEDAASQRQDRRFGEQLSDQPSAAGAKRAANRDLALTPYGARQHQAGDVGAGDQEDESDGRKRHPKDRARAVR